MRDLADMHVHISNLNFDKAEALLDVINASGVSRAALQSLTYHTVAYNLWLLYWKAKYTKMELSVFGMVHNQGIYSDIPFEKQAKALIDLGCDGIKLMYAPGSRKSLGFGINSPRYDAMFSYLEENEIPIVIHVNDPEEFWVERELSATEIERGWGYFREGFLTKQEIYDETFEMLDKHPNLRVTFAHFFFLSNCYDEAVRVMEKYPNVTFDLTPGWEMYVGFSKNIPLWHDFFERYADRIYYGTDSNNLKSFNSELSMLVRWATERDDEFVMPCYSYPRIKGLGLSEEAREKIFRENYIRTVGTPAKVKTEKVKEYAARIIGDISSLTDDVSVRAVACLTRIIETI